MMKFEALCLVASAFIGLREKEDNTGPMIEVFQRITKTPNQPWCLSFIFHCILVVERYYLETVKSPLPITASCVDLAIRMSAYIHMNPDKGDIALWRMYDREGKPTQSGHAEIVTRVVDSNTFMTIGGNTSDSKSVDREGEGVFEKTRLIRAPAMSRMQLIGFLSPWP